jgi:hypothetical protein
MSLYLGSEMRGGALTDDIVGEDGNALSGLRRRQRPRPDFDSTTPAEYGSSYRTYSRAMLVKHDAEKWGKLQEATDKLHKTLMGIEGRLYRGSSDNERRSALYAWRKTVANADPDVRDLYSMRGQLGFDVPGP